MVSKISMATRLIVLFSVLSGFATVARAFPVVDRAIVPTVGCYARSDAAELMRAGRLTTNTAIISAKIAAGRCFSIAAGQMAFSAPEWQSGGDFWHDLAVFKTASGRKFYGVAWNWRYLGEAPNLLP